MYRKISEVVVQEGAFTIKLQLLFSFMQAYWAQKVAPELGILGRRPVLGRSIWWLTSNDLGALKVLIWMNVAWRDGEIEPNHQE